MGKEAVEEQAESAMRGVGRPVTFRGEPRTEPPGDPMSWGDSKVGIGWRRGVGGREDTELLSNTWGAEGRGRFGGQGPVRTQVLAEDLDPYRVVQDGMSPSLTPWHLTMVSDPLDLESLLHWAPISRDSGIGQRFLGIL